MDFRVSGKLAAATTTQPSFTGVVVVASFDRKTAPAPQAIPAPRPILAGFPAGAPSTLPGSHAGTAFEWTAAESGALASFDTPFPAKVSALSDAAGNFELVFPDRQEIVSRTVKVLVSSPTGTALGEAELEAAALSAPIAITVADIGRTSLEKAVEPARPATRRIRGRIIERRGKRLPPRLQVLLIGHERGHPDDEPLSPILVAKADSSGYFSGAIRNLEFDRVVAAITGIPGDIPVQLVDWLVPPRIPIVVDLPEAMAGQASKDCGCSGQDLPHAPTQEDIAAEPGIYSADLGTGQCMRFNVPNRAIEEFNFYSVVRTTEPQVVGLTVGVVLDPAVEVPSGPEAPAGTGEVPDSEAIAKAVALAQAIETEIRIGLAALTFENAKLLGFVGYENKITWDYIESIFLNAVDQAGGAALPPTFFQAFPGWRVGEVWDMAGLTIPGPGGKTVYYLAGLARFDEAIKKASLAGAVPSGSPGAPRFEMRPFMRPAMMDPGFLAAMRARAGDGRAVMTKATPVDWDDTPTFHQAASISHGHLLHFRQVWHADGYSLGDLLYSLPLAPGQKKLISVVDWERREQTAREESTSAEEGLQASLSRDRDLSEIVSGALSESSRGESHNTTKGVGFGKGSAVSGSYQGFNFGGVMGVSGGFGSSDSNAFQASSRDLSSSSLQTLRDRTLQSAAAVRNLRSTIVQSARQGEAVRAMTEVVANHNHCHALTIQYFEVLRHFKVTNELADVQECLFVPLPMGEFDRRKALRWRESLSAYLKRPDLAPAFDATRRIETAWSEGYAPPARYADERVNAISGELTLTIFIPLPPIPEKPKPKPGEILQQTEAELRKAVAPAETFFRVLGAVATLGASEAVRATTEGAIGAAKAITQGANALAESLYNEPSAEERYARFQQEVMPAAAAGFVDRLELFALVGETETRLNGADFTLVSEYRPGVPLLVSARGKITTPVTRAGITALVIKSGVPLPPGCRVIVNSASFRYQTADFRHGMVDDPRVNDDIDLPILAATEAPGPLALPLPPVPASLFPPGFPTGWTRIPGVTPIRNGDGAMLYTPLDEWEQRSPRLEDIRLSAELIGHLNANLEYYHHAIWWTMDPNRRYMLLDGYQAPNASGRSVASVVDNTLVGIVGNSLILPVAPGNRLDPTFRYADGVTLLEHYDPQSPAPPSRVSLPTRGVFAEAVMGDCNACEEIDDTRFWRWEDSPIDEPPALDMSSLASRRGEPAYGTPTPFPTPIVNIQNAPQAPEPAGVKAALDAVARQPFPDITGLAGTQANAAAAFSKAMDTALAFGKEASTLAQQASMTKNIGQTMRAIDKAEGEGKLGSEDANKHRNSALGQMTGAKPEGAEDRTKAKESEAATEAIHKIPGEHIESVKTGTTEVKARPPGSDCGDGKTGKPVPTKPPAVPATDDIVSVTVKLRAFVPSPLWLLDMTYPVCFNGDNRTFFHPTNGTHRAAAEATLRIDTRSFRIIEQDIPDPSFGNALLYLEPLTDDVDQRPFWWRTTANPHIAGPRRLDDRNAFLVDVTTADQAIFIDFTLQGTPYFPYEAMDLQELDRNIFATIMTAVFKPDMDAKVRVIIRNDLGPLVYSVSGKHDLFPSFELYVNGEEAYTHDCSSAAVPADAMLPIFMKDIRTPQVLRQVPLPQP